ncbi:MAG: efflux RND transporter permease subunit [Cellvibrionaceae bacterium]|nr:efflux RND transporter permease subunit [Cellvibrionaceae bacterium]
MTSEPSNPKPGGLIDWFIHNKVAANILMLALVLGGILSVQGMRTQTFPDIDPRLITVSVVYPGATPFEIADLITKRVEESLKGIDGIKRTYSVANEGYGLINVELLDFADADDVFSEVETAVNSLQDFPPEDAERPIVTKVKLTPKIMSLALFGNVSEGTLKYWAETIEDDLRRLPGVSTTQLSGVREYQMSIEISEDSLRKYNLNFEQIAQAVQNFSSDVPAGTIESSLGDISLRVQDRRYTGEEFKSIVVATLADGASLRLGDIAKVVDGFSDDKLVARFNGQRAAFIQVNRGESSDTLSVANGVSDFLSTVSLPDGLSLQVQENETTILRERISLMLRNGIIGFMLVFVILALFLDLKLAFWTSAAIPISFLGGLIILQSLGYSINMISLFALIVVLGIVVDDGIVTGESIYRAQLDHPNDPNATKRGVLEVIAPVTIGVATTMAAFAPLLLSTGTLGQIVIVIPACVIAILFVSLIEAYFILPAHLNPPSKWSRGIMAKIRDTIATKLDQFVEQRLGPAITFCIRWRYAAIALFLSIGIVIVGMVQSGVIRFLFFPEIESDRIIIDVEMPLGTPFTTTETALLSIEDKIQELRSELDAKYPISPFESLAVLIGQRSADNSFMAAAGNDSAAHLGQITVKLVPSDYRTISAVEIERLIRERVSATPNVKYIEFQSSLVGDGADINLELSHTNEALLIDVAGEVSQRISDIPGTVDVKDSFEFGKREYIFQLNDQGLAVGLTPSFLGQQLRSGFFGLEILRYQRGRSEMTVFLRYPEADRNNISTLSETRIRLPDGRQVPLSSVANIVEQNGYSKIETVNGRRIVSVFANADTEVTTPTEVMSIIEQQIIPGLQQRYPNLEYSFEGESREQQQDLASLQRNMLMAGMIIFVLLSAQLRSYSQPFVIMSAIPFGAAGAILGHFLLGYNLTFISLFGIVALAGVVINNGVVLVDYLNQHISNGKTLEENMVMTVKRRFRPILLTTLSTCMGLLPMLLETSLQARFLIPMVISLSTGLFFSTFVILFFVPCLICIRGDIKAAVAKLFHPKARVKTS